jgi:hypothetical protein
MREENKKGQCYVSSQAIAANAAAGKHRHSLLFHGLVVSQERANFMIQIMITDHLGNHVKHESSKIV